MSRTRTAAPTTATPTTIPLATRDELGIISRRVDVAADAARSGDPDCESLASVLDGIAADIRAMCAGGDEDETTGAPPQPVPPQPVPQPERTFKVLLLTAGTDKIQVIKVVRTITNLGLKESKDLVDGAPSEVKAGLSKSEADDIAAKIHAAGGRVEVRS